ncbi:Gfo/Idh/MocA family protein [Kineococcus sp. TBRC 1896]|uniref:Gfo/Idh/MocA family protein n=1 Tax=Kineococcus mangrovi TaxID=1660183 RepID=A0ABV4I754_9ACTN
MSPPTHGVGILGAGPVTQAIHLPTLAALGDTFEVVHVMDVDARLAESVARRVGAAWTTSVEAVLADERAEVVLVCSPHRFHAEQVVAACRAGKRAVLCEKPLAVDLGQAGDITAASAETGVPIVVGAMHTFDPGWLAATARWGDLVETAHTIRSSIVLPPNPRFEDFSTEVASRPARVARDRHDPEVAAEIVRGEVMGLAVHDLPLVRAFCPDQADVEVLSCHVPAPHGYLIDLRVGGRDIQLHGSHTDSWEPGWTFEAIGDDLSLRVDFTPSYVPAGSATAVLRSADRSEVLGPHPANGYEAEWRFVADLVRGTADPLDVRGLIDDLAFALDIADRAAALVDGSTGSRAGAPA